jgi:hypothetical protein
MIYNRDKMMNKNEILNFLGAWEHFFLLLLILLMKKIIVIIISGGKLTHNLEKDPLQPQTCSRKLVSYKFGIKLVTCNFASCKVNYSVCKLWLNFPPILSSSIIIKIIIIL